MAYDYKRNNEAVSMGWAVYYLMGHDIKEDAIHKTINFVLNVINRQPINRPPQRETGAELLRRLRDGNDTR